MNRKPTFDEIVLSRRRLIGTATGAAAGLALAGGALPGLSVRGVVAQDGAKEFHSAWPYETPASGSLQPDARRRPRHLCAPEHLRRPHRRAYGHVLLGHEGMAATAGN